MSQWIVPNLNHHHHHQSHQSQQQEDASKSSSHVHYFSHKNSTLFSHNLIPMPKYEGMEKTWESGDQQEAAMEGHGHCHGEVLPQMPPTKHSWSESEDTLESIVHSSLSRKRTRSNPEYWKDETLMTEASLESHRTFKSKNSIQDFALEHDGSEEEYNMKGKTDGSCSIRQTRTAAINHNQYERRRRDRINQKMKDLQKLVPNGNKTDRASFLDDTIQYLKQLQAQVQFMGSIRSAVPQMVMPLGIQQQQQLQMSLLAARMGLLDAASAASSSSSFSCAATFPQILLPSIISTTKPKSKLSTRAFVPPTDPFCTFLAQSMDMDFYSKMVTLYCQEVNRTPQQTSKLMQSQRIGPGTRKICIRASQKKLQDLVESNKN